ncbi:uncharacterized protein [Montipora foliosa]|uniref:uncharacterized protein n=1 Tax=Montipora foliosa TaxID=591990 RepID=UPI0035F1185F
MAPKDVVTVLGLCLNCTYLLYQGQFYQQAHGTAMGSPVSPTVCNLYMEDFEQKAIATAANPPTCDPKDREGEIDHVRTALSYNGYPTWLLKDPNQHAEEQQPSRQAATLPSSGTSKKKYPVVMPYIRGFSEELRRILKGYNIPAYFKPSNTLRQLLVRPKDEMDKLQVTGLVYHSACEDCLASYLGETERLFKAPFMEHRRPSSSTSMVSRHIHTTELGHSIDIANAEILEVKLV